MTEPDDIGARIHRRHGDALDRLRQAATRICRRRDDRHSRSDDPPALVATSILDPAVEIALTATNIAIEKVPGVVGYYPAGSAMMVTTVSARHSGSGKRAVLDREEVDGWGSALVPEGFRFLVVRLGVMSGSTSGAVHYRYVLGGDRHLCALDDRDTARMRENGSFR